MDTYKYWDLLNLTTTANAKLTGLRTQTTRAVDGTDELLITVSVMWTEE